MMRKETNETGYFLKITLLLAVMAIFYGFDTSGSHNHTSLNNDKSHITVGGDNLTSTVTTTQSTQSELSIQTSSTTIKKQIQTPSSMFFRSGMIMTIMGITLLLVVFFLSEVASRIL